MVDIAKLDPELYEWLPGKSLEELLERAKGEARTGKQWRPIYLSQMIQESAQSSDPLKYQAALLYARMAAENQQLDYALAVYKDSLKAIQQNLGADHPVYATGLFYKAHALKYQRKWRALPSKIQKEALTAISKAIKLMEKNDSKNYLLVQANYVLFSLLRSANREEEARVALLETIAKCELICGPDDPELGHFLAMELDYYLENYKDDFDSAESRIKKVIEIYSNIVDSSDYYLRSVQALYKKVLKSHDKTADVEAVGAVARAEREPSSDPNETFYNKIMQWRKLNSRPAYFDMKGY